MPLILDGTTGIVANNIADFAISTAKLANGAITIPKMGYAGAVLQVVRGEYTTTTSTTNTSSWTNIGSATITPSATSNKILITVTYHVSGIGSMRVLRNSTALNAPTNTYMIYSFYPSANQGGWNSSSDRQILSMQYYDSPNTTSSTTYNVEMVAYAIQAVTGFGVNEVHGGVTFSGITLMEIVA